MANFIIVFVYKKLNLTIVNIMRKTLTRKIVKCLFSYKEVNVKVNINITAYCKAIIEEWAINYHTSFDNIVNILLDYAFVNDCSNPPIKISNAEEVGNNTIHIVVDIWQEDYIAAVETRGKRSIKISRIIEYLVTYGVFDQSYFNIIDIEATEAIAKRTNKMTFHKFLEQEQTKLALTAQANIDTAKEVIADNFDVVWPMLKFANSRLKLQSELVDYIEKILTIRGKKDET